MLHTREVFFKFTQLRNLFESQHVHPRSLVKNADTGTAGVFQRSVAVDVIVADTCILSWRAEGLTSQQSSKESLPDKELELTLIR